MTKVSTSVNSNTLNGFQCIHFGSTPESIRLSSVKINDIIQHGHQLLSLQGFVMVKLPPCFFEVPVTSTFIDEDV